MLEYLSHHTKQNSVVADHLWSLDCPKHYCIYVPYAFKRIFNANSPTGNYQIDADVMETEPNTKKNPAQRLGSFNLTQAVA